MAVLTKKRQFKLVLSRVALICFKIVIFGFASIRCLVYAVQHQLLYQRKTGVVLPKMVNARRHGLFSQNRVKSTRSNKHINSLASLAGKITRSHFTSFKSCAHVISRYVRCYVFLMNMETNGCYNGR
jgi:hypothetical protein